MEVWTFYFEKQKNNLVRVLGRLGIGRKMRKGQMLLKGKMLKGQVLLMGKRDRKWF